MSLPGCAPGGEATGRAVRPFFDTAGLMVSVAQLVELWIVAPAAGGSNPLAHPIYPHRLLSEFWWTIPAIAC